MFSRAPLDGPDIRLSRYDHLIVHCTATPPNVRVDAAWVDRVHRQRGFTDGCGYHVVIPRDGEWQDRDDNFLCRPIGDPGAHVGDCGVGWNGRSFGIALAGGVDANGKPTKNFTPHQFDTLQFGIEAFLRLHPKPSAVVLMGHRDLIARTKAPPKACPCFDVNDWWESTGHRCRLKPMALAQDRPKRIQEEDDVKAKKNPALLIPETVIVSKGDTLSQIALNYGIPLARLRELNNKSGDLIRIGEILRLR